MGNDQFHIERFLLSGIAMAACIALTIVVSVWFAFGVLFFAFFCGFNAGVLAERLEKQETNHEQ